MKKINIILIALLGLTLTNCAGSYKIKSETGKVVNQVPKWYVENINDKKCPKCLYGVGTSVSPDLQLSVEKATMIAKSDLADVIKGEMNKKAKQYITEVGKNKNKTTVTEVESTIVNIIKNTQVRGYEIYKKDITLTKQGNYRTWIAIKLPMGEQNKLYNYTIAEATDAFNVKDKANKAFENVENN